MVHSAQLSLHVKNTSLKSGLATRSGTGPLSSPTMALGMAMVCNFSWEETLVIGKTVRNTDNYSFCQDTELEPVI